MKGFIVSNLEIADNRSEFFPTFVPLKADGTAIKTAARHNPVLFLMDGGTVVKKWSAVDFEQALRYLSGTK